MASKFVYPVVGGPINGEYADYSDWYDRTWDGSPPGQFAEYKGLYVPFNRADGATSGSRGKRDGGPASLIWLHIDLLRPMIRK